MKNVRSLVDKNLIERLHSVDNLSHLIYHILNISPEQHHLWAVRDRRTLTVMTDSQMLATQLHYQQQRILEHINHNSSLALDKMKVKMTMPAVRQRRAPKAAYTMSARNAKILSSIADTIEDEELRESLQRLANSGQ